MSGIFEQIGFKKKTHVGISVSANNFIELVCVDRATKNVVKYASGNIKYNNAIREIMDYDEFTEVLEGLFDEAGLNPQDCAVSISLPNVHFGITTMDSESEEPYMLDNLQSEIEDLYIFKRNEPEIKYCKFDNAKGRGHKNVVFSAIQTKVIVKLIEIFENMQCDIVRIDTSYSSLLKTIQFCDSFNKFVQKEEKTSVVLVTANSCCVFYLQGNIVFDFFEEPLAVKSFSPEEVYSTISKIATNSISKNSPKSLLIISETDEVNAELLSERLEFGGEVQCVNKSLNTNDQFIEISEMETDIDRNMISYLTIEAVGAGVSSFDEYPLEINFVPEDKIGKNIVNVGEYEVPLQNLAIFLLATGFILGALVGLGLKFTLEAQAKTINEDSNMTKGQISVFKKKLERSEKTKGKSIFPVLKQVLDNNTTTVNTYNALSTEIPDTVYIKKFVANSEGGIGIIGEAETSEQVTAFIKGLKENKEDLSLIKLSVNTKHDAVPAKIPNGFTFEIKTQNTEVYMGDDNLEVAQQAVQEMKKNASSSRSQKRGRKSSSMTPPPPVI